MNSVDHYLSEEVCFFVGKADRVKFFQSLSASVCHPLLKRQVSLATLGCKHEDSRHVELFWNLFNHCFKEANKTFLRFNPIGWCTDMAGCNFNGLQQVYGEHFLNKIKESFSGINQSQNEANWLRRAAFSNIGQYSSHRVDA